MDIIFDITVGITAGTEKQLLTLPWIDLSANWPGHWIDLPDSLETLGNLAVQLQQLIAVAIAHPILAVVGLLLGIGLIQLVADLVKRTIQASLKFVLKLPLILSQRLWRQITTSPDSRQTKIDQLLERLEVLRLEQDQVIAELKPLLSSTSTAALTDFSVDESTSAKRSASLEHTKLEPTASSSSTAAPATAASTQS